MELTKHIELFHNLKHNLHNEIIKNLNTHKNNKKLNNEEIYLTEFLNILEIVIIGFLKELCVFPFAIVENIIIDEIVKPELDELKFKLLLDFKHNYVVGNNYEYMINQLENLCDKIEKKVLKYLPRKGGFTKSVKREKNKSNSNGISVLEMLGFLTCNTCN